MGIVGRAAWVDSHQEGRADMVTTCWGRGQWLGWPLGLTALEDGHPGPRGPVGRATSFPLGCVGGGPSGEVSWPLGQWWCVWGRTPTSNVCSQQGWKWNLLSCPWQGPCPGASRAKVGTLVATQAQEKDAEGLGVPRGGLRPPDRCVWRDKQLTQMPSTHPPTSEQF